MGIAELLLLGALGTQPHGNVHSYTSHADVRACEAAGGGDWLIASEGGLARVNARGELLASLDASHGLPGTRSYAVVADPQRAQTWWVASEGGISRVSTASGGLRLESSWRSEAPVRTLHATATGWYAGLWEMGLARFGPEEEQPFELVGLQTTGAAAKRITSVLEHEGRLWVASAGHGLWTAKDGQPGTLQPVNDDQAGRYVWDLGYTQGELVVAAMDGLYEGDARVSPADLRGLARYDQKWIGASMGSGLVGASGPARLHFAQAVGVDPDSGRTCIGSSEGLWLDDATGDWSQHLHDGLPDQDISAIAQRPDGEELWAGTFDAGLARFDGQRWQRVDGEALGIHGHVNALSFESSDSRALWIATARGLHRLELETMRAEHWSTKDGLPGTKVLSLFASSDGSMLVGTEAGPVRVRSGKVEPLGERVRDWAVWAIAEHPDADGRERIWLGTTQGLIEWRPDRSWRHLSVLSGHLRDNWITALAVDGQSVWVGTYAAGVTKLERGRRDWRGAHLGGGRINPHGLRLSASGELFAATMTGLLRMGESRDWQQVDGLPGKDVTATLESSGELWVATRRGLASTHECAE